jgi:tetratricopeptide (TPR) repeat protein
MKRIPHGLFAVMTVLMLAACGAGGPENEAVRADEMLALWPMAISSDEARQEVADGMRELDMNREDVAYEHFKRAIAADPNFAMAELFASWSAQGGPEQGFAHIARAVELSKNASEIEQLLVSSTRKSYDGDDDGALADAQQLVKIDPDGARSWDLLGFYYNQTRRRAEARAARDKAIELAPSLVLSYLTQSFSYAQQEPFDFAKAEQYARKAVELVPNDEEVYDILGDALRAQGKLEEAAQAYTRSAELDPTSGDALQQRGHVNTFLGRYAEARADYDAAVPLASGNLKPNLAMYRGFVHLYEGNPKAAVAELEQLYASVDGMNVPNPVGAKQFLLSQAIIPITTHHRMIPEAQSAVDRAAQLNQTLMERVTTEEFRRGARASTALDAGYLAYAKGDYAGARQKAAEFMQIREPDHSPTKNTPAHVLLGYIALAQNRAEEAVREFEQGNPDNILMNFKHAQALEALGRTADAEQLYNKLANFYFNPVGIALVRNDVLAKVKKPAT